MKTKTLILIVIGLLCVTGCGSATGILLRPVSVMDELEETVVASDSGWFVSDKIVIIDVDGVISNNRDRNGFSVSENPASLFLEKLGKAAGDSRVCAIVLRINSPGGTVAATAMMHDLLVKFREQKKAPIVAMIEDLGASGGYYLACGADRIVAQDSSIVGSIGVITQTFSMSRMLSFLGISTDAITSGQHKDMGSPFKPLSEKDRAIFQGMIDAFYEGFVAAVDEGRPGLSAKQVRKLADGRVYTGAQAKANGLVDQVGFLDDAIRLAKQMAGAAKVKVVMYHRPFGYRGSMYSQVSAPQPQMAQINMLNINAPSLMSLARPQFMYLWTGHTGSAD